MRAERDTGHAEGARALDDLLPDPAEAEHPERLAHQFVTGTPGPLAGLDVAGVTPEILGQRDHQTERVFGDGRVVDAWRIEHGNASRGRVSDVD